jgi:VanZ family protein
MPVVRAARYNGRVQKRDFWRSFALYVVPLLLWMAVIFFMSTPTGSADNTRPIVRSILRRLFPDVGRYLSAEQVDQVDIVIRKGAHVAEYTIFGLLAYRAFRFGRRDFKGRYPASAIALGLLYAASDEYHQSFFPSRGASPVDVMIDLAGVSVGTLFSLWGHCAEVQRRLDAAVPAPDAEA